MSYQHPTINNYKGHQLSAFVAGIEHDGTSRVAYGIYDNGKLFKTNSASLAITIDSAIVTGVWSVTHYIITHGLSMYDLDIYISDKAIANALTEFWYMALDYSKNASAPKIDHILQECCHIKSVAFDYLNGTEDGVATDYAVRMVRLKASLLSLSSHQ